MSQDTSLFIATAGVCGWVFSVMVAYSFGLVKGYRRGKSRVNEKAPSAHGIMTIKKQIA